MLTFCMFSKVNAGQRFGTATKEEEEEHEDENGGEEDEMWVSRRSTELHGACYDN